MSGLGHSTCFEPGYDWVSNNSDPDCECNSNEYQNWYFDLDGDGLGLISVYLPNVCTDTTEFPSFVLNSDDDDDSCYSNAYADYCVDSDGDDHADAITSTGICTDHAGSYFASDSDCAVDTDDDTYCLSNTFNT